MKDKSSSPAPAPRVDVDELDRERMARLFAEYQLATTRADYARLTFQNVVEHLGRRLQLEGSYRYVVEQGCFLATEETPVADSDLEGRPV